MYGDFSRHIGDLHKHYVQLLQQQGRLPLDADFNELGESVYRYIHQLVVDVIGPYGTAVGSQGFAVGAHRPAEVRGAEASSPQPPAAAQRPELTIGSGFYYVSGQRCEFTGRRTARGDAPVRAAGPLHVLRSNVSFLEQVPPEPPYLVFLRAWERTVTSVQDPELADVAFEQFADTTVRTQLVWQVLAARELPGGMPIEVEAGDDDLPAGYHHHHAHQHHDQGLDDPDHRHEEEDDEDREFRRVRRLGRRALRAWRAYEHGVKERAERSRGTLRAAIAPGAFPDVRNELHLVEVHHGGWPGECSFKHSRDNGSTLFRFKGLPDRWPAGEDPPSMPPLDQNGDLTVLGGADAVSGLQPGMWLEYVDDMCRLPGRAPLVRITAVHEASPREGVARLTVAGDLPQTLEADLHPVLRQWDHVIGVEGGEQLDWSEVPDGAPRRVATVHVGDVLTVTLRTGREPFHSGDHWLIPLRSRIGGMLWPDGPQGGTVFVSPERFDYHEAPLALVTGHGLPVDLRSTFYGSAIWEPRVGGRADEDDRPQHRDDPR